LKTIDLWKKVEDYRDIKLSLSACSFNRCKYGT